ncbi:MAG: hypothetical protein K2P09_00030 [Erysipelotrichales bacterium]|nr:hypothetical protein [Erysipelotrichales bacterium]
MGYIIEVNHKDIKDTASIVRQYVVFQNKKMKTLSIQVDMITKHWQGEDFNSFLQKWKGIDAKGSITRNLVENLSDYANYLDFVANMYIDIQSKAVNRADRLPKR